jgi:peptide deformylase
VALRTIITLPNPNLRIKATRVPKVDDGVRKLMDDMVETMQDAPGIGLAATQIDVHLRVIVFEVDDKVYQLANPEIVRSEGEQVGFEGCLSIPNVWGEVKRAEKVVCKGLDRNGKAIRIKGDGLLARVIQHEIDHLDGVLFTDKADPETLRSERPEEEDEAEPELVG